MSRKTVTVFGATGTAGSACVDELIRQDQFNVQRAGTHHLGLRPVSQILRLARPDLLVETQVRRRGGGDGDHQHGGDQRQSALP